MNIKNTLDLTKAEDLIKPSEGLRLKAYQDEKGIWTIGWGCTHYQVTSSKWTIDSRSFTAHNTAVEEGDEITIEQAEAEFQYHLQDTAQRVLDLCYPIVLTENQLCALTSLVYNIGIGNFRGSTLLKMIHNKIELAADQFLVWDKERINGALVESKGLKARREREKALFLT